jgi:hypothetical protein
MLYRQRIAILPYILIAVLMIGILPLHAMANNTSTTTTQTAAASLFTMKPVGKVMIDKTSYITLQQPQQLGRTIRFTLSFHNSSKTELQFIDYWVRLKTKSNSRFSASLIEAHKNKNRISPNTTEIFTFTASVSEGVRLSDIIFELIRWDFRQPSFERSLGTITVPANYTSIAPQGTSTLIAMNGVNISTKVKQANITASNDKLAVDMKIELENTGTKSVVIPAYEYLVVTSEALAYSTEVLDLPANFRLFPKMKKEITLKGELPSATYTDNLRLVVSEPSNVYADNVPIAAFYLPKSTSAIEEKIEFIPKNGTKTVQIDQQPVELQVRQLNRITAGRNIQANILFSAVNQGKKDVTIPKYTFLIQTESGVTYPVTADLTNIRLDPFVGREIEMNATLAGTANPTNLLLVMKEVSDATGGQSKTSPVYFHLYNEDPIIYRINWQHTYANAEGTYRFTFKSVQRLPWEDDDLLSATFEITNTGATTMAVPKLSGDLRLDERITVDTLMVNVLGVMSIRPNETIPMVMTGKIPYTHQYDTLKLLLKDTSNANAVKDIVLFTHDASVQPIRDIAAGETHNITSIGRAAQIKISETATYVGTDRKQLTSRINLHNQESRFVNTAAIVGYYATLDGRLYPATFTEVKNKVAPDSGIAIMATTTLPNAVNTAGMTLIMGEGTADGKLVSSGTPADAYINVVRMKLPPETTPKVGNYQQLALFPYTISIGSIYSYLTLEDNFHFGFDYELTKIRAIDYLGEAHQLLIEVEDLQGNVRFTKSFTLDQGKATEQNLELGKRIYAFENNDMNLPYAIHVNRNFNILVYDVYNGNKKLIAKKF